MQAICMPLCEHVRIERKLADNLDAKLKLKEEKEDKLLPRYCGEERKTDDDDGENGAEEEEFSFNFTSGIVSPISADDIFQNGQIRPLSPLPNRCILFVEKCSSITEPLRSTVKKLFYEEGGDGHLSEENDPEEPYCAWRGKAVEISPQREGGCRRSYSTGFSKLWRYKEREMARSNSDGKDAYVFTNKRNPQLPLPPTATAKKVAARKKKRMSKKPSAHELHYVRNRERFEEGKRKSFLPYKQDIVGFFTNVNRMSKSLHPF